jgi:tetratricopeptide (TPR) repeat protein
MRRAEELVGEAIAAAPCNWFAHYAKGSIRRSQGRCEEAIPEYETTLALNPNWINALDFLAWCKFMTGSIAEGIPLEEQVIRLSPRDPYIGNFYLRGAYMHLLQSHSDEAIVWYEKARNASPGGFGVHSHLASASALKGDRERAAAELAEAGRLAPDDRYSSIARLRAAGGPGYWGVPKVRALYEATYFEGLRKAGMPEG